MVASRNFHLFYNVGYNFKNTLIRSNLSQVLADDSNLDFPEIGNNNRVALSDLNFGLGIKTQIEKFEFILEAKPQRLYFSSTNNLQMLEVDLLE